MFTSVQPAIADELAQISAEGLFKNERVITSPQRASIAVANGTPVLNMCANNYLGLADDPRIITAAKDALNIWGYGLASVRFICGTQQVHKQLESRISRFLGTADTILYSSCFDANGGLFETLLGEQDAVISDELNHASIIDGIRLSKARRLRYRNRDMADLEEQLKACADARRRLIATDGVFSMDGYLAPLREICDLADRYDAMVMVDDSHAVGFVGPTGRGTPELHGVIDRVDIVTGTLGKALGGASGGYTSGRQEIIDLLRQRSRPYLFSNSVAPAVVGASLKVLEVLEWGDDLRARLRDNTAWFRERMTSLGFDILPGDHPIVPVMIGDAARAARFADLLLAQGVYAIGFSYPVVPIGKARIRVQVSAAHSREDLELAANAFAHVRDELDKAERAGEAAESPGAADTGQNAAEGSGKPAESSDKAAESAEKTAESAGKTAASAPKAAEEPAVADGSGMAAESPVGTGSAEEAAGSAGEAAERAGEAAESAGEATGSAAKANGKVGEAAEKTGEAAERTGEAAQAAEGAEKTTESPGEAAGSRDEAAGSSGEAAGSRGGRRLRRRRSG